MSNKLVNHTQIWKTKKILREVYTDWYMQIAKDLCNSGTSVELGSGTGNFKVFQPAVIASDIQWCEWLDVCFDAHKMPFPDNSLANLVMIDVLHHLSNPIQFFQEASRVLQSGGRILMVEPFPSPLSLPIYQTFHPEPFIWENDYFNYQGEMQPKDPWEANQAIAYLLFFKKCKQFLAKFESLKIIKRQKMSCLLYPLSGGFEHQSFIPDRLISVFKVLERILIPLRWLMAFRCYIVVEKI